MNVDELMTREVHTCSATDSLDTAARLMWEHDCGCAPVLDADGRLTGIITDRDIAMAAFHQGRTLSQIAVSGAMSKLVHACQPDDAIEDAEGIMRMQRIRRLPVIDEHGRLVGILSLNDVARGMAGKAAAGRSKAAAEVAQTLAAICEPRRPHATASA
jgi:CBS domain-containing protein